VASVYKYLEKNGGCDLPVFIRFWIIAVIFAHVGLLTLKLL